MLAGHGWGGPALALIAGSSLKCRLARCTSPGTPPRRYRPCAAAPSRSVVASAVLPLTCLVQWLAQPWPPVAVVARWLGGSSLVRRFANRYHLYGRWISRHGKAPTAAVARAIAGMVQAIAAGPVALLTMHPSGSVLRQVPVGQQGLQGVGLLPLPGARTPTPCAHTSRHSGGAAFMVRCHVGRRGRIGAQYLRGTPAGLSFARPSGRAFFTGSAGGCGATACGSDAGRAVKAVRSEAAGGRCSRWCRAPGMSPEPVTRLQIIDLQGLGWSPRQESNLYLALRRHSFYPLNYEEDAAGDCRGCAGALAARTGFRADCPRMRLCVEPHG